MTDVHLRYTRQVIRRKKTRWRGVYLRHTHTHMFDDGRFEVRGFNPVKGLHRVRAEKINYFQMLIEGLEKQSTLILEFGGIAEITPRWYFGAHIYNLTQARIAPTVVKAGLSYRPFQTLSLNLEVLKDIDFEPTVRLGLEYEAFRFFRLRTGFNDQPFKAFGGIGFHKNRLSIDYSYGTHQQLGGSSQISVSYHTSPKTDDD